MEDNLPFWTLTIAYALHIFEEYALDWRGWAQDISKLKLNWSEFFIANFAVIILGVWSSIVGFTCPALPYTFVGLAVVNAIFAHIGTTIVKHRLSPGVFTSIFLFLPISAWAYLVATEKGLLTFNFAASTLTGGFLIMMIPVILQVVKNLFVERKK